MSIEQFLQEKTAGVVGSLYGPVSAELIQIQKTRKDFEGDLTVVVFPLLKQSHKSPEATAKEIGEALSALEEIRSYNVIKGFLKRFVQRAVLDRTPQRHIARRDIRPQIAERTHDYGRIFIAEHQ